MFQAPQQAPAPPPEVTSTVEAPFSSLWTLHQFDRAVPPCVASFVQRYGFKVHPRCVKLFHLLGCCIQLFEHRPIIYPSTIDGYVGCFPRRAILERAAVTVLAHRFWLIYVVNTDTQRTEIAGSPAAWTPASAAKWVGRVPASSTWQEAQLLHTSDNAHHFRPSFSRSGKWMWCLTVLSTCICPVTGKVGQNSNICWLIAYRPTLTSYSCLLPI